MSRRHRPKTYAETLAPVSNAWLQPALAKRTKRELVTALCQVANEQRTAQRQIEAVLNLQPPPDQLVAATRRAIADATKFDERRLNYNFDFDWEAYEAVARYLARLIESGQLSTAMKLSLELIDQGSLQMEASDEGLMSANIESCLRPVIAAVRDSRQSVAEKSAWAADMIRSDRGCCLCSAELNGLAALDQHESSRR